MQFTHRKSTRCETPHMQAVAAALFNGAVHRKAGVRFQADGDRVIVGIGPISGPCRIIIREASDKRVVMVYRTLPGHPEKGEESFMVERVGRELVATVSAVSEGATWYTRNPVAHLAQRLIAKRYAGAMLSFGECGA